MSTSTALCCDWVSPPGDTILEIMRDRQISLVDFATAMGISSIEATNVLNGSASITILLARKLTESLGASVEFWMNREYQYREDLVRLSQTNEEWLRSIPIKDMIDFNWIPPFKDPKYRLMACLRFFGVPSVAAWSKQYNNFSYQYAFKSSSKLVAKSPALATWLRQGEIEAELMECLSWNKTALREALPNLRRLTRMKDPNEFLSEVKKICSNCGVAVVVVRAPKGCPVSGATKFISNNKALLLLSVRFLSDDHFWFTFFHEIGHLLLHEPQKLFIEEEGRGNVSQEELEANNFSRDILIPEQYQKDLLSLGLNMKEIIRFSNHIKIPPGIVVGQLQHIDRLGHNKFNSLKRRYQWAKA